MSTLNCHPLRVVQARPSEVEVICAILEEAARWLSARGIDQWPASFDRAPVAAGIERGEVYLAIVDGQPAGTVRLQAADPSVWGDDANDALYVHRLAVRPTYRGHGLGLALLQWAEGVALGRGKTYLRLDCMLENDGLRRYYLAAGFRECGMVAGPTWSARLFEKQLATEAV